MDPDTAHAIATDRQRDLRRAADAHRLWRAARRSADHPSLRRRPGEPSGGAST